MSGAPILFDHFDNPNTVDLNTTYLPGFNFYISDHSPLSPPGGEHGTNFYIGGGITPSQQATAITVNNSLLTINPSPSFPANAVGLFSIRTVGGYPPIQPFSNVTNSAIGAPQSWTGFTYGPPYLLEFSVAFNYNVHLGANAGGLIWCDSAQFHTQEHYFQDTSQISVWNDPKNAAGPLSAFNTEIDYFEIPSLIPAYAAGGFTAVHVGPGQFAGFDLVSRVDPEPVVGGVMSDTSGVPTWNQNQAFTTGFYVYYAPNGNIYNCTASVPGPAPNPSPPSDPTHWTLSGTPASLKVVVTDFNNQNTHHILHVPYTPEDGPGQILLFYNGFYIQGTPLAASTPSQFVYHPTLQGSSNAPVDTGQIYRNMVDNYNQCSLFLIIGWSQHQNDIGDFCAYDWISMRK